MPDEPSALFGAQSVAEAVPSATVSPDTLGVTNAAGRAVLPAPFDTTHCRELDAPSDRLTWYATGRVPYTRGMEAIPRPQMPGNDTGVMAMLMALLMLLALNCRNYATFFKTFTADLLKVRERDNIFDDHTLSETRIIISLLLSLCVCEGILLFSAVSEQGAALPASMSVCIAALTVAAGVYYCWQFAAYAAVGYLFTAPWLAKQWLRGFNASQALLGLFLLIPAMGVLFRPEATEGFLIASGMLYVTARLIFICKGFKIFYHNSFSLIYFILYLCTLEIVPLIFIYRGLLFLRG